MQRIAVLLFPGFQMMSLAAISAFEFTNLELGEQAYDIAYLSETGGPVQRSFGVTIETNRFDDPAFDTLLVSGAVGIQLPTPKESDFIRNALARLAARRIHLHRRVPARRGRRSGWSPRHDTLASRP